MDSIIKMGSLSDQWNEKAKTITFCVTEDCNLSCKYCYMTGKNKKNKMTFDIAKNAVDYILSNKELFNEEAIIWDFIGGEPFLEIKLIDQISDYIKQQMFLIDHPWFDAYRFSFSSNGILYHTQAVQDYIKKNKGHLSIGISVDGNKIKHNLQRVKPDGTGSYEDVMKNVPLWLNQFPGSSTKATFSHADLPYLKDSIISLWDNGINMVAANVVFEDVWEENDDVIFESQLIELADYIIEKKLWNDYSVRFFDPNIGFPLEKDELESNFCGSGKMLAIDYNGRFYPCVRFYDMSLNNKKGYCIGDIYKGIDNDKIRPFLALSLKSQSKEECINCEVASGCAWCVGCNYDMADTDTIYQRATFICKMHKANVRANEYFWSKFSQASGLISPREKVKAQRTYYTKNKYLQIILSDNITPHCSYRNWRNLDVKMSTDIFNKGIKFAEENGFIPVLIGGYDCNLCDNGYLRLVNNKNDLDFNNSIILYDNNIQPVKPKENCILLINKDNIVHVFEHVAKLSQSHSRINIIYEDIEKWDNEVVNLYESQLDNLINFIVDAYKKGIDLEVNVLTDILYTDSMNNCNAGNNTFTLAPNGKIYICPAFYFDDIESYIGTLDNGIIIKNAHLLEIHNAPICSICDTFHCKRCKFINKKLTNEINIPPKIQCTISHIERKKSRELQIALKKERDIEFVNILDEIDYLDPLDKIINYNGI